MGECRGQMGGDTGGKTGWGKTGWGKKGWRAGIQGKDGGGGAVHDLWCGLIGAKGGGEARGTGGGESIWDTKGHCVTNYHNWGLCRGKTGGEYRGKMVGGCTTWGVV